MCAESPGLPTRAARDTDWRALRLRPDAVRFGAGVRALVAAALSARSRTDPFPGPRVAVAGDGETARRPNSGTASGWTNPAAPSPTSAPSAVASSPTAGSPFNARLVPLHRASPAEVARLHVSQLGGEYDALLRRLTGRIPPPYHPDLSAVILVTNQVMAFTPPAETRGPRRLTTARLSFWERGAIAVTGCRED